jgi:hypothetical protein
MSTNRYPPPPRDTLRTKTKDLGLFIAGLLALALLMATPLAGSQIPSAKAQQITEENNSPQAQGPAASINATQTGTLQPIFPLFQYPALRRLRSGQTSCLSLSESRQMEQLHRMPYRKTPT